MAWLGDPRPDKAPHSGAKSAASRLDGARQYSAGSGAISASAQAASASDRRDGARVPRRPSVVCCSASLQRSLPPPRRVDVPGVELAQVARGALGSPRCSTARSITQSSSARISVAVGPAVARAEHLLEQPRVAQRAAGQHDRGGAGALVGVVHLGARAAGRR